jgi:hypothetical protein
MNTKIISQPCHETVTLEENLKRLGWKCENSGMPDKFSKGTCLTKFSLNCVWLKSLKTDERHTFIQSLLCKSLGFFELFMSRVFRKKKKYFVIV